MYNSEEMNLVFLLVFSEAHKPDGEDVFMEEDEEPKVSNEEIKDEPGGWTEVKDTENDEDSSKEDKEEIVPDEIIHEVAVGKGLSGALKLLKERGTLKESIDWGGRNMDKKKSKLVGIVGDDEPKEIQPARPKKDETRTFSSGHSKETHPPKVYQEKDIRIERTDEFGRIVSISSCILCYLWHYMVMQNLCLEGLKNLSLIGPFSINFHLKDAYAYYLLARMPDHHMLFQI